MSKPSEEGVIAGNLRTTSEFRQDDAGSFAGSAR